MPNRGGQPVRTTDQQSCVLSLLVAFQIVFQQPAVKSDGNKPVNLCSYIDFRAEVWLVRH